MSRTPYDTDRMREDLLERGWNDAALAARARVARSSVSRFMAGASQAPAMAKRLARALGKPLRRYVAEAQS